MDRLTALMMDQSNASTTEIQMSGLDGNQYRALYRRGKANTTVL